MTSEQRTTPREIDFHLAALESDQRAIRRAAADQLFELVRVSAHACDTLLNRLEGASENCRWGVAYALARTGCYVPSVVCTLVHVLGSSDSDSRWAAAELLSAETCADTTIGPLLAAATSQSPVRRRMVAYTLRQLAAATEPVEKAILDLLDDTDRFVRLAALAALPVIAVTPERCATQILSTADDPDKGFAAAKAVALSRLAARSAAVEAILLHARSLQDPVAVEALERHRAIQSG